MKSLAPLLSLILVSATSTSAVARGHRHFDRGHRHFDDGRWQHARYGAISHSTSSGRVGWSYGYESLAAAQTAAAAACGWSDCTVVTWEQNRCAVLALGRGAWGASSSESLDAAEDQALAACSSQGRGACYVERWVCW